MRKKREYPRKHRYPTGSERDNDFEQELGIKVVSSAPKALLSWWKRVFSMAQGDEFTAVAGGQDNRASHFAAVGGGQNNAAEGMHSIIPGGASAQTHLPYQFAHGAANGREGGAQFTRIIATATTQPGQPTATLTAAGSPLTIPFFTIWHITGKIIAFAENGNTSSHTFTAVLRHTYNPRPGLLHLSQSRIYADPDPDSQSWAVSITADTTNTALAIHATGSENMLIDWLAILEIADARILLG